MNSKQLAVLIVQELQATHGSIGTSNDYVKVVKDDYTQVCIDGDYDLERLAQIILKNVAEDITRVLGV